MIEHVLTLTNAVNDSMSPVLTAGTENNWVWRWLSDLIGGDAATVIQILVMTLIYGLVIYLDGIQLIRLMNNFGNRNNDNANIRNEARESIKSSFFIIACVTIIGGVGFTALCFFMNTIIKPVTA
ncbi:MAG: hypothetical protein LBH55_02920 [Mycoplasmataceae bacterium]|nr:hypothetical protein [Mycoplasmataceae bacterium]